MSASNIDPHDKMRARDVGKVARGEQAPRPPHEYGSIRSAPPKPSSKDTGENDECYKTYIAYHKCLQEKSKKASECKKLEQKCRSLCPSDLIDKWNKERELGTFSGPV